MSRCSHATALRSARARRRITLDELVDAGEAMLLEMVKLTRTAVRQTLREDGAMRLARLGAMR